MACSQETALAGKHRASLLRGRLPEWIEYLCVQVRVCIWVSVRRSVIGTCECVHVPCRHNGLLLLVARGLMWGNLRAPCGLHVHYSKHAEVYRAEVSLHTAAHQAGQL